MNSLLNTANSMRTILRSFALLDFISIVFLGMQLWYITHHFNEIVKVSEKISALAMFPMFILLIVSTIRYWVAKKTAFIIYYIQFPFRLYLWVFTIGFITLLPEAFELYEDFWFKYLLVTCYAVEFIRLFLTISAHIKIHRLQLH